MNLPIGSEVLIINSDNKDEDFLAKYNYYIPAYQRPYLWGEEQIDDFLKTILDGFNSNTNKFFGTMQFVVKDNGYDIVDGQQRLTTMKLFMYILAGLAGIKSFDFNIDYKNMKNANETLSELMAIDVKCISNTKKTKKGKVDDKDNNSVFETNIQMLKEKLLEYHKDDFEKRSESQYAKDLINYFGNSIYVVILKTRDSLPLPEIVNIFNTINTTGMDLNTEDIFKFQYYEYLRKNEKCPDTLNHDDYWIEKVNACYRKIEDYNSGKKIKEHISMADVLSVYQHCICAKYEDDYKTLAKSSERFFTDLFKNPSKYSELLSFSEFDRLVDEYISFYTELNDNYYVKPSLHALSVDLIKQTRYPRYWTFPYVYSFLKGKDIQTRKKALCLGYQLFAYLIVHSINYAKAVNPVHTFVCKEILPRIINEDGEISELLKAKQWSDPYDKNNNPKAQEWFKGNLEMNAVSRSKTWVVCLLLAINSEKNTDIKKLKEIFFNWEEHPYDIEHIFSKDTFSEFEDDDKAFFNGIGNLIVLEQKINRDMGRKGILKPSDKYRHRSEYYEKSEYRIVKEFTEKLQNWDLPQVQKRCDEQLKILIDNILNLDMNLLE